MFRTSSGIPLTSSLALPRQKTTAGGARLESLGGLGGYTYPASAQSAAVLSPFGQCLNPAGTQVPARRCKYLQQDGISECKQGPRNETFWARRQLRPRCAPRTPHAVRLVLPRCFVARNRSHGRGTGARPGTRARRPIDRNDRAPLMNIHLRINEKNRAGGRGGRTS